MTYLDLINRFWELDKIKQIPLMETKLYLFLLQECNLRRWLNPFELRTRHLAICLGISRKTIAEVRNRLKLTGLIDIKTASGTGATIYLIPEMPVTDRALFERHFDAAGTIPSLPLPRTRKPSTTTITTHNQPRYETHREDKFVRRRGVDPSSYRPEDYTSTL